MELYISEFSKYVIALLIALYTFESFLVFRFKDEKKRSAGYMRQTIFMFALHFSCFIVICFETGDIAFLFFYAFQQIVLYATAMLFRLLYPASNRLLVNNFCTLLSIGFVMLTRLSYKMAVKQFIIATGSLVIALIIPFFVHKFKFLKNLQWIYALVGMAALGIVLILGQTTYGSKLSYSIAGITFQPSEFVKIIFVFYIASALYKASGFFEIFTTAVVAGVHVVILVCSKDLGSALIFFVVYVLMVYIASGKIRYLFAGLLGGSTAAYIAFTVFSHVQVRVQAWKDPWSVIDSAGYQITQSLFAISSGGWFGLGLYKGIPDSIPFVEADFIFSAIAEELGIIFAVCLILICVSSFIMMMNISAHLKDKFYQLTAFGLGVTYIFQIFLTIGGGTKFIPLTGVTLPLVSYGGSSVLTTLILFSVTEGLFMIRGEEETIERQKRKEKKRKMRKKQKALQKLAEAERMIRDEEGEEFESEED